MCEVSPVNVTTRFFYSLANTELSKMKGEASQIPTDS